jgi:hypothetical protein
MKHQRFVVGLATLALTVLWGCSGGVPPATLTTRATAKGTVKVKGKLIKGGLVGFSPKVGNDSRTGPYEGVVEKDGSYIVGTYAGTNYVTIIPERKLNPLAEEITVELKAGENTQNLEFK